MINDKMDKDACAIIDIMMSSGIEKTGDEIINDIRTNLLDNANSGNLFLDEVLNKAIEPLRNICNEKRLLSNVTYDQQKERIGRMYQIKKYFKSNPPSKNIRRIKENRKN